VTPDLLSLDNLIKVLTFALAAAAAYISWLNFRKSGTQKLAHFRKEWIENLRTHMAEYNALRYKIAYYKIVIAAAEESDEHDKIAALRKERNNAFDRAAFVTYYIRLMLNMNEELHRELDTMVSDHIEKGFDVPEADRTKFRAVCRKILKAEWEKTKSEM
jgi:hypothetical protein